MMLMVCVCVFDGLLEDWTPSDPVSLTLWAFDMSLK